ncbi:MAG: nicotinate (nicotinamide) nucleotide adenylyltransferase [Deltaproteobacteria bacterium]|nr:nicotinate (nicotinamide) nucleotide adenylyltransferase [Deltaproteobacteria bacterium]
MDSQRTTVALFGGTFDPFHNGHLRMAVEVMEALGPPRVVLLPAHHPPHKPRQPVSDARHRIAMTEAAVAGLPGIEVSDREIRREGPSYSLLTVLEFRRAEPSADLVFVVGADAFAEVSAWHRYEELLAACDFVLLPRPGTDGVPRPPSGIRIEKEEPHCYSWKGNSFRLPGGRRLFCPSLPTLDISSRAIREKVRTGKCIRGLVPQEVERYIREHGLYIDPGEETRP